MDKKDELPTMPSSQPPASDSESATVWLVSYSEDDDRELRIPAIAEALQRGEINGQTIVWTDGMPEWLPIARVPSLARLLPATGETEGAPQVASTGGFLGTGMQVAGDAAPENKRASSKPPLPSKRPSAPPPESAASAAAEADPSSATPSESGPDAQSASPAEPAPAAESPSGAASESEPSDDEEPVSVVPESVSPESAAAYTKQSSDASPVMTTPSFSIGDAEPSAAEGDEEIEEAPSSGTPSLSALASLPPRERRRAGEDLIALGDSDAAPAAPPTIDISNIASDAPKKAKGADKRPGKSKPESKKESKKEDRNTTPPVSEGSAPFIPDRRSVPAEERKTTSVLPWLVALGACGIAAWALLQQRNAPPPPPPELPKPEMAAERPTQLVPPEPILEPETTAEPEEAPSAQPEEPEEPEAATVAPAETAKEKPSTTSAPVAPTEPPKTTPAAPAPTANQQSAVAAAPTATQPTASAAAPKEEPKEESTAPPFDKAAAAASLGTQASVASSCRKEGDPIGNALVTVTFASSGRAIRATVDGPPFAGTATGGCIASTMRKARVPAFSGDRVTVHKTVRIQ